MTDEKLSNLYNRMWYRRIYHELIDKCRKMEKEGYSEDIPLETHHIIPKKIWPGGENIKSNMVKVPIRYHITLHALLMFAYPGVSVLAHSAKSMLASNKLQKRYGVISKIPIKFASLIREEAYKNLRGKNPFKGKRHSEESRQRMSISHKNQVVSEETKKRLSEHNSGSGNPFYGKHHTEETKRIISLKNSGTNSSMYGKKHSQETIEKMRQAKLRENHPMYGKHFSEEVRKNMSLARKGNKNSKRRRIIDSGNNIFDSIKDCSRYYGIEPSKLRKWANGTTKDNHGFRLLD